LFPTRKNVGVRLTRSHSALQHVRRQIAGYRSALSCPYDPDNGKMISGVM